MTARHAEHRALLWWGFVWGWMWCFCPSLPRCGWHSRAACCWQPVAGTRWQLAERNCCPPFVCCLLLGIGPHYALVLHSSPAFCFPRLEQETKSGDLSWKLFPPRTRALLGVNYSHLHNVISLVFFRPYLRSCFAPVTAIVPVQQSYSIGGQKHDFLCADLCHFLLMTPSWRRRDVYLLSPSPVWCQITGIFSHLGWALCFSQL